MKVYPVLLLLILAVSQSFAGTILYVDSAALGGNNGSSWYNAYVYLQDAFSAAQAGDQVWVKKAIYKPDRGTGFTPGNRSASFNLKSGVSVYGGFVGTETSLEQRNPAANVTTLSGDLSGNDGGNFANTGDNSYHVVKGSDADCTALLDGFTIAGGNANGSSPDNCGSGLYIHTGSPAISNCTFTKNWAASGGCGAWITSCDSFFSNCVFTGNYSNYYGGAFYAYSNCSGQLVGCTFISNTAANNGGALRIRASEFTVDHCTFSSNLSQTGGGAIVIAESAYGIIKNSTFSYNRGILRAGAILVDASSDAQIESCTFNTNASPYGGAIRCSDSANTKINKCTFKNNGTNLGITSLNGGAFYSIRVGSIEITNSFFLGNKADSAAAICLDGNPGQALVANCVFSGNTAQVAGAVRVYSCTTDIINCTFSGNTASDGNKGRSIAVESTGLLSSIKNSILWENGSEIYGDNGTFTVNNSNLAGGWSGRGSENISSDPFFISPAGTDAIVGTEDDDLRLYSDSPCINKGLNTAVPETIFTDIKGDSRIGEQVVDMGAYEDIGCGDASYPYPLGDLNNDCRVNVVDLSILSANWLLCADSNCN